MRLARHRVGRAGAVFLAAASVASAIVVVQPTEADLWSTAPDAVNTLVWSLTPGTWPPPKTVFFDVWVRNAAPGMYEPGLNISLATGVDSSLGTTLNVTTVDQLRPGGGYQLFLADPTDASVVYCSSDVFAVASPSAPQAAATSNNSSSSNTAEASVSVSVSTTVEAETVTLNHFETVTSEAPAATSSPFHSARRPPHSLGPAVAPGSPQDQGFGLVVRSGASLTSVSKLAAFAFAALAAASALPVL